jgi:hypothetical protein
MRVNIMVILLLFSSVLCAAAGEPGATKHYENSLFKTTEKGLFSVELLTKGNEFRVGSNKADIIVHDRNDRDVTGAQLTITPWMPAMGHGVFEKPAVMERGGGLYSVDNLHFNMGGHWQLRIQVIKDSMADEVSFDISDVQTGQGHAVMHAPPPSELDLSTSRLSASQTFRVSYKSALNPIVINTIHSWDLKVESPDGQPVSGAEIIVRGDMPQHGHGMPTEPEAVEGLKAGTYLIEGMKFSMPGWWIVNFHIKSGDREDTVTFNLQL